MHQVEMVSSQRGKMSLSRKRLRREKSEQDGVGACVHMWTTVLLLSLRTAPAESSSCTHHLLLTPASPTGPNTPPVSSGSWPKQWNWAIPHIFHSVTHWTPSRLSHIQRSAFGQSWEICVSEKHHLVFIALGCTVAAALGSSSIINPYNWQTSTASQGLLLIVLKHSAVVSPELEGEGLQNAQSYVWEVFKG